ncbi:MAG: hypothetical protein ACRC8S_00340 [Fimbriiglobus sp.]
MAHKPQSRLIRGIIAAHIGLSIISYVAACLTSVKNSQLGYDFFVELFELSTGNSFWLKAHNFCLIPPNFFWLVSITFYFTKLRLGQMLLAFPGILVLIAYVVLSQVMGGAISCGPAPWLWAASMALAFYAALINYITHPRPQAMIHQDA